MLRARIRLGWNAKTVEADEPLEGLGLSPEDEAAVLERGDAYEDEASAEGSKSTPKRSRKKS